MKDFRAAWGRPLSARTAAAIAIVAAGFWGILLFANRASPTGETIPAALYSDPKPDPEHPANLALIRYPTAGVAVPARMFIAAGAGPHPTVLFLHGLPGMDLSLDLARSLQRAGWNVLAIHYRGVWGAPGQFGVAHTIEDTRAALSWLRDPANAQRYGIDTSKLVLIGHSVGGFDAVMAGDDPMLAGFALISPTDVSEWADHFRTPAGREDAKANLGDQVSYTNTSLDAMGAEIIANAQAWDWRTHAAKLKGRPVLIISANDGNQQAGDDAAAAIIAASGQAPSQLKLDTDHWYNDHRIALQVALVSWLERAF